MYKLLQHRDNMLHTLCTWIYKGDCCWSNDRAFIDEGERECVCYMVLICYNTLRRGLCELQITVARRRDPGHGCPSSGQPRRPHRGWKKKSSRRKPRQNPHFIYTRTRAHCWSTPSIALHSLSLGQREASHREIFYAINLWASQPPAAAI